MFDQEEYFRKNKWGSIYIPPYRDLRQIQQRKESRWPMAVLCSAVVLLILAAALGPV